MKTLYYECPNCRGTVPCEVESPFKVCGMTAQLSSPSWMWLLCRACDTGSYFLYDPKDGLKGKGAAYFHDGIWWQPRTLETVPNPSARSGGLSFGGHDPSENNRERWDMDPNELHSNV